MGSFQGELLKNIVGLLPEYDFEKIAVDINEKALRKNKIADSTLVSNLNSLPIENKSVDLTLTRYTLHWNEWETQEKIISEIKRVTKKFAIVQIAGCTKKDEQDYWAQMKKLFSGEIPILKRKHSFWCSDETLEEEFRKQKINFKKVEELRIPQVSENIIFKYSLKENEARRVREILGKKDYVIRITYVLFFG